jgi:beta-phosphoglucomutase-like phosphatase (HAD superfamily)
MKIELQAIIPPMSAPKKGVIFDFNGTLFSDVPQHSEAWAAFSATLLGHPLSPSEVQALVGKNNRLTLESIVSRPITDSELQRWSDEKEVLYRKICLEHPSTFHLADGAVDLLDFLKANAVPMAVASMAGPDNMAFYEQHFGLAHWFARDHLICDTGDLPSKPDPAIYLKALTVLGLAAGDCIVVEDSLHGIEAARNAGIGFIYAIGAKERHEELRKLPGVADVIADFKEFDRALLGL